MFSLLDKRFTDILVQPARKRNEYSAFCSMVDSADIPEHSKVIFFGDRGYTSYNNFAHVIEKGQYFLIRCNDKRASGMMGYPVDTLPAFDEDISLILTRSKAVSKYSRPELFSSYRYIYQNAPMDYLNDQRTEYDLALRLLRILVLCQEKVQIKYNQFSLCLAKLNLLFLSHFLLDFSDILPHIGLGINTRNGCEYVLYCKMFLCIQKSTYMHVYN